MAGIPDKIIIFRKFDLWWPLLTSIFTWAKKWPKWLRTGSLRAVDRRIARPSSFPSFRVRVGGGSFCPPPPPWRRWLRPPPGRGLTLARFSYFATFAGGGGGTTPYRSALDCRRASRKKKQSMRLDEISRCHILFLVLGQHLTSLGQVKGHLFAKKWHFSALHAHSGVSMCRSDLKPPPACSLFNSEQDRMLLLYSVATFSIRSAPK